MLVAPVPAGALPALVTQSIHFEVPGQNLIPNVAAFRASCDVTASGEALSLRDNQSVRTTVAAVPGNCSMILILFGVEVGIPTITTTPIGRDSFYIPGLTTLSLGIVDVSLDLQTGLSSRTQAKDASVASVEQSEVQWGNWGAQRLVVRGAHGYGSVVSSELVTDFNYSLALGLTVWVAGVEVGHTDLANFGQYEGASSLATPVTVDLLPHSLLLGPARSITSAGASLNWTGAVDADIDHLELWVTDGTTNVSYRVEDPHATAVNVALRPVTDYTAWIVAVDGSGQETASPAISFRTLTVPPPAQNVAPPTYTESQANVVVVGTFLFIALLAAGVAYGFGRVRGRT